MKTSSFAFRLCSTCVVLLIAVFIVSAVANRGQSPTEAWAAALFFIGVVGAASLVVGIIASIWEK